MSIHDLVTTIQRSVAIIQSSSSTNQQRQEAQYHLDTCVQQAPDSIVMAASLKLLENSGDGPTCHFALSTIGKFIRARSHTLTQDEWSGLKSGLLSLFSASANLPFFVSSKLIDVICEVALRIWPNDWTELLPTVIAANKALSLCLFGRICDTLSEDSLSIRCVAPERQLSLRVGLANASEELCSHILEVVRTPEGTKPPQLNWVVELVNGLAIATKQSSHLVKFRMDEVVRSAFTSCSEPNIKMVSVDCLSNFIHYLNGQSGRAYTVPRATRSQEQSMLVGILETCKQLLLPGAIEAYMKQEDIRDSIKAFFDLLTDIRRTANIFSYFNSLDELTTVLVETISLHPSVVVQTSSLANLDAMLRTKNISADNRVFLVCFLACHDFYTMDEGKNIPVPPLNLFPHLTAPVIRKRRELFQDEVEEEDIKSSELIGKLKNAALLCVRHIATVGSSTESFCAFLQGILNDTISAERVTPSYQAALLLTEALATTLPARDRLIGKVSTIVDIVCSTCPVGSEQQYLWFVGKAGSLITTNYLQCVFQNIMRMDIANNFPAQVAFISLCKTNGNCGTLVSAIHQALSNALAGEMRSWAIGAVLSASAHAGLGAADGYATSVFNDVKAKLEIIVSETDGNVEDFAKRATPMFATLKAVLEVPLSPSVLADIATEISTAIIPYFWSKIMRCPVVFEIGQNEFLSVLGSQFVQTAQNNPTAFKANACFQLFLVLTQTAGLCSPLLSGNQATASQLLGLFDPSWSLRPSLLNILLTNVALPVSKQSPITVIRSIIPQAITSLRQSVDGSSNDDFCTNALTRVTSSLVNVLLTTLQITTDDEVSVSDFSGAPKPVLTQRQVKANLRSRNRFTAIIEEAEMKSSANIGGPKIPFELARESLLTMAVLKDCLYFRTDKAIRRMFQSLPTIITRWWNTVSHDANMATSFVNALPENVIAPIAALCHLVKTGDPLTMPGGALYSYTCDRAVSGRRLASELVEQSSIAIQSIISVMWKYSLAGRPGNSVEPLSVISNQPSLARGIEVLLGSGGTPVTEPAVLSLITCAREQSLESRASLKYIIQGLTMHTSSKAIGSDESGPGGNIGATSKDLVQEPATTLIDEENDHSQVNIFG